MSCGSTESTEDLSVHDSNVRKRVGKACDRCRLKKSKCDGNKPCGRCRADNQVCLFGERKKTHDKVYPKGYVELLEHQQSLLVSALQLVYKQYWTGPSMPEVEGFPLVHDLLEHLGLLQEDSANSPVSLDGFHFEEDLVKMQVSLAANDGSRKQISRRSHSPPILSPVSTQASLFRDSFSPMQPSTPQDQRNIINITNSIPTASFPYHHLPASVPTDPITFHMNQPFDQMKFAGLSFQTNLANGPRAVDFENLDAFSSSYPVMANYGDVGDFVDEDSFGTFVDLGASSEII